jgi:hypothetical protein
VSVCVRRTTHVYLFTYTCTLYRACSSSRSLPVCLSFVCCHSVKSASSRHNHTKHTKHYAHQFSDRHQVSEASERQGYGRMDAKTSRYQSQLHSAPTVATLPMPAHELEAAQYQQRQQNESQAQLPRLHPHPASPSYPTPIHNNPAPKDHHPRGDLFQISTPRRGRDESLARGDAGAGGSAAVCTLGIEVVQVDSASSSSWSNKSKAKRFLVGMLPSFALFLVPHPPVRVYMGPLSLSRRRFRVLLNRNLGLAQQACKP